METANARIESVLFIVEFSLYPGNYGGIQGRFPNPLTAG
jgi:hypothetical protein